MEYIIRGLSILITIVIVRGVLAFLRRPKKAEQGKVYLPKFFVLLGLITSTVFIIPTFITAFSDEPSWITILLFVFSLLGAIFIIAFVNCRVSYDDEGFISKNFFGFKRQFTYDQVTAIKENTHKSYIYVGKRKVMIDKVSVGGKEFIVHVKKRYGAIHNGKRLPIVRKTKHDIFNGHVDDAFGFIFVYILGSVVFVAFTIILVKSIYFSPSTIDNTIEREVIFESCDIKKKTIILKTSDDQLYNQLYKIAYKAEDFNAEKIKSICDGKTSVTTYSTEVTRVNAEPYYSVKAILIEDTYLLSFEETNRWNREGLQPLFFFFVAAVILWAAYVAGSIIVGRNPKKYSKKVIKLFFKDGYVKY